MGGMDDQSAARKEELQNATQEMFERMTAYLMGELNSTSEDYQLLEKMNSLTAQKYFDMANTAEQLTVFMKELREKYTTFQPFLEKIDQLEKGVQSLEDVVQQLDEYSKRLEAKFKQVET